MYILNYVNCFWCNLHLAYICLSVSPFHPICPHLSPLFFLFSFSPILPVISIRVLFSFHAYQLIIIHFIFTILYIYMRQIYHSNRHFLLMLIIKNCHLRPIPQLQFIQNRTQIISDRSLTQIQFRRYLLITVSARNQPDNFLFPLINSMGRIIKSVLISYQIRYF